MMLTRGKEHVQRAGLIKTISISAVQASWENGLLYFKLQSVERAMFWTLEALTSEC